MNSNLLHDELRNHLIIYKGAIAQSVCEALRNEADEMTLHPATVGLDNALNERYRNTLVSIFPEEHWIRGVLFHYGAIANNNRWNYDISGPSPAQYARYDANSFYNWHADCPEIPMAELGDTRKITVILNISDNTGFEGGEFCMRIGTDTEEAKEYVVSEINQTGTIIVFPSIVSHKVKGVTSGTRMTVTSWIMGPQFR